MSLSLLLANTRILLCFFFLFLVVLNNCLVISVAKDKISIKLALAIPTKAPTMLVNEIIDTPSFVALKKIKTLSM